MASTKEILDHHQSCFAGGDLPGIMEDYTDESRLFTPQGVLKGKQQIQGLFEMIFAEFAKPGASYELANEFVDGDTAYINWSAETADNVYELGTDTFVIRDGKIAIQSFSGKITPK